MCVKILWKRATCRHQPVSIHETLGKLVMYLAIHAAELRRPLPCCRISILGPWSMFEKSKPAKQSTHLSGISIWMFVTVGDSLKSITSCYLRYQPKLQRRLAVAGTLQNHSKRIEKLGASFWIVLIREINWKPTSTPLFGWSTRFTDRRIRNWQSKGITWQNWNLYQSSWIMRFGKFWYCCPLCIIIDLLCDTANTVFIYVPWCCAFLFLCDVYINT